MAMTCRLDTAQVERVFERLFDAYGEQHWWPADTPFEVMLGAILTQNTSWQNVEKALDRLRGAVLLDAESLLSMPREVLADHLRPAGYYNLKAGRLAAFLAWYCEQGGYAALNALETTELRSGLLGVHGIGPETADDMLLYAFGRPVFVIDAYTRRLFGRLGMLPPDAPYESLRAAFETAIPADAGHYGEWHALIVAHAKSACRSRPVCADCPLRGQCPAALHQEAVGRPLYSN